MDKAVKQQNIMEDAYLLGRYFAGRNRQPRLSTAYRVLPRGAARRHNRVNPSGWLKHHAGHTADAIPGPCVTSRPMSTERKVSRGQYQSSGVRHTSTGIVALANQNQPDVSSECGSPTWQRFLLIEPCLSLRRGYVGRRNVERRDLGGPTRREAEGRYERADHGITIG